VGIDDDVTPFKERVTAEAADKHGSGAEVASLILAAVPPGLDVSGDKQARWQLPSADRAWSYQTSLEEVFPQGSLLVANSAQRLTVSLFISPIVRRTTKQTTVGDGTVTFKAPSRESPSDSVRRDRKPKYILVALFNGPGRPGLMYL
jgi:hypothetical protein